MVGKNVNVRETNIRMYMRGNLPNKVMNYDPIRLFNDNDNLLILPGIVRI